MSALPRYLPGRDPLPEVLSLEALRTARRTRHLSRPPDVADGVIDVLRLMGGDDTAHGWAMRLGVGLDEIERAMTWIQREAEAA